MSAPTRKPAPDLAPKPAPPAAAAPPELEPPPPAPPPSSPPAPPAELLVPTELEPLPANDGPAALALELVRRQGGKTLAGRLTREERRAAALVVYPDVERPRRRADCQGGPRPCPFVSCRHHLYLDVITDADGRSRAIKFNHPAREVWELEASCALDVADAGGATLERVGELLDVTRERTRQVEVAALGRIDPDELELPPVPRSRYESV